MKSSAMWMPPRREGTLLPLVIWNIRHQGAWSSRFCKEGPNLGDDRSSLVLLPEPRFQVLGQKREGCRIPGLVSVANISNFVGGKGRCLRSLDGPNQPLNNACFLEEPLELRGGVHILITKC